MQCLRIAGLKLRLEGYRLGGAFEAFAEPDGGSPPDLTATVVYEHDYTAQHMADALYRTETDASVSLQNQNRLVFVSSNATFFAVEYDCRYTHANYYFNNREFDPVAHRARIEEFLYIDLRRLIIGRLFLSCGLILHSASVLFQNQAFALSAPSGTGKSTHAQLWADHFGAQIIDGDANALRAAEDAAYLYGLPWCGTSGICSNERAPLRAVVFLEQAPKNRIIRLAPSESIIRMTARCYLPVWDAALMRGDYFQPAEKMISRTECYVLQCRPDKEAAEVLRQCLY